MLKIAILCAANNSSYTKLPNVEVFGINRDARTFAGGMPIVAHPPCRAWSIRYAHMAKPEAGERELGLFCAEKLRECGGILEQPAHSRLFRAVGLPCPGELSGRLYTLEVHQSWWGFPVKKATWLAFCGISASMIHLPLRLHDWRGDGLRFERLSKNQRAATTRQFAEWLVDLARKATV
jgi:hypothetical protein